MIDWEIFYRAGNGGKDIPLIVDRKGKAEPIAVNGGIETIMLAFDFFDPDLEGKPLPEIELKYDWDEFGADPARGKKPKMFLSASGRRKADSKGTILFDIPLAPEPSIVCFFEAEVIHIGVGAYPDDRFDLDIPIKKVYNGIQEDRSSTSGQAPATSAS